MRNKVSYEGLAHIFIYNMHCPSTHNDIIIHDVIHHILFIEISSQVNFSFPNVFLLVNIISYYILFNS